PPSLLDADVITADPGRHEERKGGKQQKGRSAISFAKRYPGKREDDDHRIGPALIKTENARPEVKDILRREGERERRGGSEKGNPHRISLHTHQTNDAPA